MKVKHGRGCVYSLQYHVVRHPDLRSGLRKGHLWNPSYFAASVSEAAQEQIRDYIRSQKEK